jgi:hypothetical protein
LAVGLAGAIGSHYYAVLLMPALGAAEIARTMRTKQWNGPAWLAFCAPVGMLALSYPFISAATGFSSTFWAKPQWVLIHAYHRELLAPAITGLVFAFSLAGLYVILSSGLDGRSEWRGRRIPLEEIVLAVVLCAAPVMGVLAGKLVTNAFAWRYAIGGVLGLAILLGFSCFTLFRGNSVAAFLVALTLLGWFGVTRTSQAVAFARERAVFDQWTRNMLSLGGDNTDIVIGDTDTFYKVSYYGPPAQRKRFVYLADTNRSVRFLGQDTPDRSMWTLRSWFGIRVENYSDYISKPSEFFVVSTLDTDWTWLPSALVEDGIALRMTGRQGLFATFTASTK